MSNPAPVTATKSTGLFYPTDQKLAVLKNLARFHVLTVKDLAQRIFGNLARSSLASIVRSTRILERDGLITRIYFRPDSYAGRGLLPLACGLSECGAKWARDHYPESYPKAFPPEHSPHTIEHEFRCARTDVLLADLAEAQRWDIGAQKTDTYHIVKPDRLFEITTNGRTYRIFLEEEHKKKNFDEMYRKLKPYVRLHGSDEMKRAWGFRYFHVLVSMRDADAARNVLVHFQGGCNCIDPAMRRGHYNSPLQLNTDCLIFTVHGQLPICDIIR